MQTAEPQQEKVYVSPKEKPVYEFFKRFFDVVFSALGLIVLSPLFGVIALLIHAYDRGPVLYTQERLTQNGRIFHVYKFRSMRVDSETSGARLAMKEDDRITPVGRVLRNIHFDELPQLFCILKGDMSIVGPRPALWNQDDLIAERDKYGANDVRPGLTGWAQINGRDELEIAVKAKLDGDYVAALNAGRFRGFAMDVRCFFGTIRSVLRSDGVVEGGTGEMKKKEKSERKASKK
jgi:O-antigen biosynthesis protein WbqP